MLQQCDWTGLEHLRFSKNQRKRKLGIRAFKLACEESLTWEKEQKALYFSGKLPQDKIDRLNATEGWTWGVDIQGWMNQS